MYTYCIRFIISIAICDGLYPITPHMFPLYIYIQYKPFPIQFWTCKLQSWSNKYGLLKGLAYFCKMRLCVRLCFSTVLYESTTKRSNCISYNVVIWVVKEFLWWKVNLALSFRLSKRFSDFREPAFTWYMYVALISASTDSRCDIIANVDEDFLLMEYFVS